MTIINGHLTRQLDIIPMEDLNKEVHIIGAGAIGSFTTLMLAKMGITNITVYDYDTVSIENMSCQFYRFSDIGKPKVEALRSLVMDFTGVAITAVNGPWTPEHINPLKGIVIAAADSMEARRDIFEHCRKDYRVDWFIDSRLGAESALLYIMNAQRPEDQKAYNATLYMDANAVQERCTAKATIYCTNLLAGQVVKGVKNLITRQPYPRITMWNVTENSIMSFKGTH